MNSLTTHSNLFYDQYHHPLPRTVSTTAELHEALAEGWLPQDRDFLIKWIEAGHQISDVDLDVLLNQGFHANESFYEAIPSIKMPGDKIANYVVTLARYTVSFPSNLLMILISMNCEIEGIRAVVRHDLPLTARELRAAGTYCDPIRLLQLGFFHRVVCDGYVVESIFAKIERRWLQDFIFNNELIWVLKTDTCRTTTLNLALWLTAPLSILQNIHTQASLDTLSCILLNRHAQALRESHNFMLPEPPNRVMRYLLELQCLPFDVDLLWNNPVDENHLFNLLAETPCWNTTLLNILLLYGCTPKCIEQVVRCGAVPDAMSWRLVAAEPLLKEALTTILPER